MIKGWSKESSDALEELLLEKLEEHGKRNSSYGFLTAVAVLKHIMIRSPEEHFGYIVKRWTDLTIEENKENPLWKSAFSDMNDDVEEFVSTFGNLDEEEEEDEE